MPTDSAVVPETQAIVDKFESHGRKLTTFSFFGQDPLQHREDLLHMRDEEFFKRYPDFSAFFHSVVNHDYSIFRDGLLFFIDLSHQFQNHL